MQHILLFFGIISAIWNLDFWIVYENSVSSSLTRTAWELMAKMWTEHFNIYRISLIAWAIFWKQFNEFSKASFKNSSFYLASKSSLFCQFSFEIHLKS